MAFLETRISGPTASRAGIGNVISSPTATDFARRRDNKSFISLARTETAGTPWPWMLATRSRHTGMVGLKDARTMLSAGIIAGPCRDAKWRFGRNVGQAVRSASLSQRR